MLIIDEEAESTLATVLETLKTSPGTVRCIYLNLEGMNTPPNMRQMVVTAAKQHIANPKTHLFFCSDGDMVMLSSVIHTKEFQAFAEHLSTQCGMPANDNWISFYQVSVEINRLLVIIEHKLAKKRKARELLQKQREAEEAEHKRDLILSTSRNVTPESIKNRRSGRKNNEVMIIEDDVFSRRLVENVLNKEYSLTGLAEASHALETYASLAPDILFLDINLPDVTGHELLQKILTIDPEGYVVMLSGNADKENIMQAMNEGAKGFIAKPFTRDKLLQYIERCPTIKSTVKH